MDFTKIARNLSHCGEGIGNYTEEQAKDCFYIEKALKDAWNAGIDRSGNYCDAYARYKESMGGGNIEVSMIADVICKGIRELKVKP